MNTSTVAFHLNSETFTTLTNQATGESYPIDKNVFWVGRSPACDVTVDDPAVSERHLKFEYNNKKWVLNDLSTKNGTTLNHVQIKRALVPSQNTIKIGRTPLELKNERAILNSPHLIVGNNKELRGAIKSARLACNTSLPIMILGETGTGKELFAQLIHNESRRAKHPFVPINCGAVPPSLFASEMFGHQKGAFTDAKDLRHGLIEQAGSGTLFLDEIGELPSDMQPLLLRLIEDKRFRRLGDDTTSEIKCRFVAATNNLDILDSSRFRQDLFYRLGAICIELPPLRKRKEDIPILLDHFLESNKEELGKPELPSEMLEKLMTYPWPGNIRELKHVASRLAVLGPENLRLGQHFTSTAQRDKHRSKNPIRRDKAFKKALIHAVSINGSIRKSADYLGIPKSTLAERLTEFNILPRA